MAERNMNADLGRGSVEESILNVTQDNIVTTNDFADESIETDVDETVVAGGSKDKGVNIFNQLALMMEMMSGMKTEIKSEINTVNVKLTDLNNEFVNVRSELRANEIYMNSRLESMSEVIVGVKDVLTSDINKIQNEMKNDIKIINEKQKEKMLETNRKFDTLTSKFNDKFKKQNDKIDCNVRCLINECKQSEIQENINDEFRNNFEQVDTIKIKVTSLKNKQAEHEREIMKVRKDLNVTINQILTNVSERDLYRELHADRKIELYKLIRNYDVLRKILEVVNMNHIKYLPVEREIENYFENICINDNDLHDVVVEEYNNDKTIYLTLTSNTNGDWTIITYVDKFYERLIGNNPINCNGLINDIELMDYYYNNNNNKVSMYNNDECYKYVRYIYDDGG